MLWSFIALAILHWLLIPLLGAFVVGLGFLLLGAFLWDKQYKRSANLTD